MPVRNGKVRVLIAARERELRDQLRQMVVANRGFEVAGVAVDGQEAVQLAVMLSPDLALVQSDLPIFNGLEAVEMIGLAVPGTRSVLFGDGQPDTEMLGKAMRSGARAYLPSPLTATKLLPLLDDLADSSTRRSTPEYLTATDPALLPKLIVVTGGKGGIGKTTVAAGVAMCLAKSHPGKVALFDLYTQFGDVATMLDIDPPGDLTRLAATAVELDIDLLQNNMATHDSGVRVLVSATEPQPIDSISVECAENTLHALKRAYTYIVVDLPPILYPTTLYVLSSCYQLLLITTLFDIPTLRNAKELLDKVTGTYVPREKIYVVANRVSKHDRLRIDDVERTLGLPVSAQVPNDPRLVSAINQGIPFITAYSRSPLVGAIESVAQEIVRKQPSDDA